MVSYISKIEIKNFKAYENITYYPNEKFNIIVGENNIGKSTIFEAIILWDACLSKLILSNGVGFYKPASKQYISFQELDFIRLTNDHDLFNSGGHTSTISVTLNIDGEELALAIEISKPASIQNSFFRINELNSADFQRYAEIARDKGKKLDEMLFIYQTRPVANILQEEPYYNEAQIKHKILQGHSHEVLRNKILNQREKIEHFKKQLEAILQQSVDFKLPPKSHRNSSENIDLKVREGSKWLDLHMQGSGFLQVAEIISTIDFIDAPLKLLLVDEPDSHIHSKLQSNLINYLRELSDNQFFIISHNDRFVDNALDGEVFFLHKESKISNELNPIRREQFDVIKRSLGGVLMNLSQLNSAPSIVFVEGNDDAEHISSLVNKISLISKEVCSSKLPTFFPLRGKDDIATKIEYIKRTLSGLFKDKSYGVIFDRDFSSAEVDASLKSIIENKIRHSDPFVYSHAGYCIESSIFASYQCLKTFLCKFCAFYYSDGIEENYYELIDEYEDRIKEFLSNFGNQVKAEFKDHHSSLRKELEKAFGAQKVNRPEMKSQIFSDFTREVINEDDKFKISRIMNKKLIVRFMKEFEKEFSVEIHISEDTCEDAYCTSLFEQFIESFDSIDDIPNSYKKLIRTVLRIDSI
ncbi:MAG: ATP-binding protein [Victivallaceae bacterium]|nr:ATP-binding protein [Victivallaceae bacterium]